MKKYNLNLPTYKIKDYRCSICDRDLRNQSIDDIMLILDSMGFSFSLICKNCMLNGDLDISVGYVDEISKRRNNSFKQILFREDFTEIINMSKRIPTVCSICTSTKSTTAVNLPVGGIALSNIGNVITICYDCLVPYNSYCKTQKKDTCYSCGSQYNITTSEYNLRKYNGDKDYSILVDHREDLKQYLCNNCTVSRYKSVDNRFVYSNCNNCRNTLLIDLMDSNYTVECSNCKSVMRKDILYTGDNKNKGFSLDLVVLNEMNIEEYKTVNIIFIKVKDAILVDIYGVGFDSLDYTAPKLIVRYTAKEDTLADDLNKIYDDLYINYNTYVKNNAIHIKTISEIQS